MGDLDGDGQADFGVGSTDHGGAGANAGRVAVRSGADPSVLTTIDGASGARLGSGLTSIADMNGDGVRDLVVGASDGGDSGLGQVFVMSSASGETLVGPMEPGNNGQDLGRTPTANSPIHRIFRSLHDRRQQGGVLIL